MAVNITQEVENIRNATYARDVRNAMADSLAKMAGVAGDDETFERYVTEATNQYLQEHPDAVAPTDEQVNAWLDANGVTTGATAEQAAQIERNTSDIQDLQDQEVNARSVVTQHTEKISQLSEEIANLGDSGTGLTTSVITALLDCFENVAWANDNGQTYYNALQSALLENRVSVSGVALSKASANIYTGYSEDVSAIITPSNASDKSVTWSSSDENIAVVEANGLNATIKGISDGSAIITCTTNDGGYIDTFTVTVSTATVDNVTLNTTQGSLAVGKTVELTVTVSPDEVADKTVIWTTSSSSIATVTPSADTATALVEAVAEGTATITATCGGKSATYTCVVEAVELEAVIPELYCRTQTGEMAYYYYAEDIDTLDTSDTSQILQDATYRMLCFDCSNASTVRLKRNVLAKGYSNPPIIYAFNHKPILYPYISDVTASPTSDAAYKFITFPLTGYNNNINVGDVVTVGDYELNSDYKWLVIKPTGTNSDSSTEVADYVDENGFYDAVTNDSIKIEIVN